MSEEAEKSEVHMQLERSARVREDLKAIADYAMQLRREVSPKSKADRITALESALESIRGCAELAMSEMTSHTPQSFLKSNRDLLPWILQRIKGVL